MYTLCCFVCTYIYISLLSSIAFRLISEEKIPKGKQVMLEVL